jgi:hypothetical protein
MPKMTKGAINKLRCAGMLFRGEPGRWQTADGMFEIVRTIEADKSIDRPAAWGVWDNADDMWAAGSQSTEFATMREAVHFLKSFLAEEV